MVVEHIFVTTMEPVDAMSVTSQFLAQRGFVAGVQTSFQLGAPGWNVVEMARGRKTAARAKSTLELPQQIRVEYDRGRVTVAASALTAKEAQNGRPPKGKPAAEAQAMLLALVQNVEYLLVHRADPATLMGQWSQHEDGIHREGLRRRARRLTILWSIVGVLVLLIALAIIAATRRG
ncbi:MAG TPA: hypothetical protein VEA69_20750 [Tepidisphaeraceae bacterium]|nr:hypothetical protein [Tepidisphaeraceae bacterium]